jgi:ribosome-binding factor A
MKEKLNKKMIKNTKKIIQKHISNIIQKITNNIKNNIVTVTDIKISQDFSKSIIYISALKDEENTIKQLNMYSKEIKHNLALLIKKNKIPNIKFILDKSISNEEEITKLIEKTKNVKKNNSAK